jgi:hypothetical protein
VQSLLSFGLKKPEPVFSKPQYMMTGRDISKCSPVEIVAGDFSVDGFAPDLAGAVLQHPARMGEAVHHNFLRGGRDYEEG